MALGTPGNTASVNAVVDVLCPFSLSSNSFAAAYMQPADVRIGYSTNAIGSCTIPTLTGNVAVTLISTGSLLYSADFSYSSVGTSMFYNTLTLNSIALGVGNMRASFEFSGAGASNASSASFYVLTPANVVLSNFSALPGSSPVNSQITIGGTASNYGGITAGNVVLNMLFTGPTNVTSLIREPLGSVGSLSNEIFQVTLGNVSGSVGAWNVVADITYNSVFVSGSTIFADNFITSNNATAKYTVTPAPSGGSSSGPYSQPLPPKTIGELGFSNLPLFIGMVRGSSITTQIGLMNNGSRPLWVNFSLPAFTAVGLSLTATSVLLLPKQGQSVGVSLMTTNSTQYGTYVVPIGITATPINGTPTKQSLYLDFRVSNSSFKNTVTQSISLLNYSKQASAAIQIRNPSNQTLYNSTLQLELPLFTARSKASIVPSGLAANVSLQDNDYLITYYIPVIKPGETLYAYYTIKNVTGPEYLSSASSTFVAQASKLNNTLRIIDISVPTFTVGQKGWINVTALYVGPLEGNASFGMGGPSSVSISNPFMAYHIFPNMVLNPSFMINPINVPGTYLLTLYTSAPGANQSYSIPIVVLQNSSYTGTVAHGGGIVVGNGALLEYLYSQNPLLFIFSPFAIVIAAYAWYRSRHAPRHTRRKERMEKLMEVKEQIKRGSQ
jgi:hypothetical protein